MATNTIAGPIKQEIEDRWAKMRTHKRIISQIRFHVEWDEGTEAQRANGVTVDVSHSGCMAIVGAPLPLHNRVKLIHQTTDRSAEAEVVWSLKRHLQTNGLGPDRWRVPSATPARCCSARLRAAAHRANLRLATAPRFPPAGFFL